MKRFLLKSSRFAAHATPKVFHPKAFHPMPRLSVRWLATRSLTCLVGCLGLVWGISNVARGETFDAFLGLEARLLKLETVSRTNSITTLNSAAARDLNACDDHAQHALMLLEIPLTDAALRSGAVQEFDQHIRSLEARARRTLGCTPRDSLVWLLLFGLENEHGLLDEHAFDLLAMSYDTSPNEAWIAVRRVVVAIPVVLFAPEPIQQRILTEFQNLIRRGFVEMPARSYLSASGPTRELLQSRIEQLDPRSQKAFSDTLQKLRS
jgi:hypothetical protein